MDIIDHTYIMALDPLELERPDGKKNRRMSVVNDNKTNLDASFMGCVNTIYS